MPLLHTAAPSSGVLPTGINPHSSGRHASNVRNDVVDTPSLQHADADDRVLFRAEAARLDGLDRIDQAGHHG